MYKVIFDYFIVFFRGKWFNWLLGNYDVFRIGIKVGYEYFCVLNVFFFIFFGIVVIYYGEEIGMIDVEVFFKISKDFRDF